MDMHSQILAQSDTEDLRKHTIWDHAGRLQIGNTFHRNAEAVQTILVSWIFEEIPERLIFFESFVEGGQVRLIRVCSRGIGEDFI